MNKYKKTAVLLLLALLWMIPVPNVNASELTEQVFISVKINGQVIFTDTNPYVKQNRTFVPVRFVAEAFGMNVHWNQEEKKVIIADESTLVELWQDRNLISVNGKEIIMDVNTEEKDGRIMVPVRHFAEAMGFSVEWDNMTCSVALNKEEASIPASVVYNRPYTDDDIVWLSRIIHAEGKNLGINGKVAIANVVLNRVKSSDYPDTVCDVIFDTRFGVQFPPAHKTDFTALVPENSCIIAAKMALEGINNVDKCLYFNDKPFKNKSADLFNIIEGEYFYY